MFRLEALLKRTALDFTRRERHCDRPARSGRAVERPFGVRLYLTLAFAAVALITAGLLLPAVTGSSDEAASRARRRHHGRAHGPRSPTGSAAHPLGHAAVAARTRSAIPGFSAWVFDAKRQLLTPGMLARIDSLTEVAEPRAGVTDGPARHADRSNSCPAG